MIPKCTPLALSSPSNSSPLHPTLYSTSLLGYLNLTYPKLIDFHSCPPKAISSLCPLHFIKSNRSISCSRKKQKQKKPPLFILYIISNTSNPSKSFMGSTFKMYFKINQFSLPPPLSGHHTLSLKLNSFPTSLPMFALVLLQATKQPERSFRILKVNHVNHMSFLCSELPGGCPSHLPCNPNSLPLPVKLWMI